VPAFSCLPVRRRPCKRRPRNSVARKTADLIHEGRKKLFERKGAR
jgi:hypothetical protein